MTFAFALGLAPPLQAGEFITSSIDVSGGAGITITAKGGNQAIVVEACVRSGNEGVCVTDSNGGQREGTIGIRTVEGLGRCTNTTDRNRVFCTTEDAGGPYDGVTADLDAFDDRLDMQIGLPLTVDAGLGDDFIQGSNASDTLRGGGGADFLVGRGGGDRFNGEGGDDTLIGGLGDDRFRFEPGRNTFTDGDGGGGIDEIDYSASPDPVNVTVGTTRNDGPAGEDDVQGGIEELIGTSGADSLTGDSSNDTFEGRGGSDTLNGLDGDDVFFAGTTAEDDTVNGGAGSDDVVNYAQRAGVVVANLTTGVGGSGAEEDALSGIENLVGGAGADTLTGNAAANHLAGREGNDTLRAAAGPDTVSGGAGDDDLEGGDGDDTLETDGGADDIQGGPGSDGVSYFAGRTSAVRIDLTGATTSGGGTSSNGVLNGSEGDRLFTVENAQGTRFGDSITGNNSPNFLAGDVGRPPGAEPTEGGRDSIDGRGGDDTIFANAGDDALFDGPGRDVVDAGPGDDFFATADAESDRLDGDLGNNVILFQTPVGVDLDLAADTATVGDSTDQIVGAFADVGGTQFNDVLRGDDGTQALRGGGGDDQLFGRGADDVLDGGPGKDQHDGGLGSDEISGGSEPNDIVDYSEATTPVSVSFDGVRNDGRAGENDLLAGIENVWGGASDDTITGGPETNVLYGNPGNDTVRGLGGNDTITGGAGEDTLEGADGNDIMEAADSATDGVNCGAGDDTITADPIDVLDGSCETGATFIVRPAEPPPEGTPPAPGNQPLGGGVDPGPTPAPEDDRFVGVQIGTQNAGPPTVTGFSASPRRFRRLKGTTFSYSTNEAGAANVKLERIETGRRKGNRCVKTTRKNRNRGKCKRIVAAGTVSGPAVIGANQLKIPRAIRRNLQAGRHRATLTVSDPAGLESTPLTLTLTVRR